MQRITVSRMTTSALAVSGQRLASIDKDMETLTTGRQINRPSDDPAGFAAATRLRDTRTATTQYVRNADRAESFVTSADAALLSVSDLMARARELVIQASSGTVGRTGPALAEELISVREQLVGIANERFNGEPLFSGYDDVQAVTFNGATWQFNGDVTNRRSVQLSDSDVVTTSVDASEVFVNDSGTSLFDILDAAAVDAAAGNSVGLGTALAGLAEVRGNLGNGLARLGAAGGRIAAVRDRMEINELTLEGERSRVQDADLAETVSRLRQNETIYQVSLQALSKTLPQSLAAYMR
jgi:flagellar hook-associated protein 3 FlgL